MLRRAAVAGALLGVVVASGLTRPRAQEPQAPPVFRGGVDVVQIDVTVLDENRQPVRGLTAADFTVLERGEPQPIVSFGEVNLPPRPVDRAPWVREIGPDVTTNSQDAQRVVVIFMDDFSTSFDPGVSKRAKTIAHAVIDALGPSDIAAVIFSMGRRQGQEFTVDRARLRAAVDRFSPSGLMPSRPHQFSAARNPVLVPMGAFSGACMRGSCIQDAMRNTAEILGGYPGSRKTFVYISPFTPVFEADSMETVGALSDWAIVLREMQAANMTVYQFDPRGLEVGVDIREDLGMFSDATGGRTYKHTNAPEDGVPQMFRENSSYYMLGIQPLNLVRNGRFRPIDVRVNRPGITVRTRSGYFAPRDDDERRSDRPERTAAERAIEGALPAGDLAMSLAATARPGSSSRSHRVDVLTGFVPLGLAADGEDVEVLVTAFRDDWREVARITQTVRVTRLAGNGAPRVDIPSEIELPPGRYEVRVALTRTRTSDTGSAFASLTVPDFDREPLSLSGVLIERAAPAAPTGDGATKPLVATTVRQFLATDLVVASLSVQQGGRASPVPATVELTLVDDLGRTRASRRVSLAAGAFTETRSAGLHFELPLVGLEPGEYLASFEASSSRGSARRQVRLIVR